MKSQPACATASKARPTTFRCRLAQAVTLLALSSPYSPLLFGPLGLAALSCPAQADPVPAPQSAPKVYDPKFENCDKLAKPDLIASCRNALAATRETVAEHETRKNQAELAKWVGSIWDRLKNIRNVAWRSTSEPAQNESTRAPSGKDPRATAADDARNEKFGPDGAGSAIPRAQDKP
jgi:hypothetical protein